MKKNIVLSLVLSGMLASGLNAATQDLNIKQGWNLLGNSLDNVEVSALSDMQTSWAWDAATKKWKVYSSDTNIADKINALVTSGQVAKLQTLNGGDGFWVNNATATTTLTLNGETASKTKNIKAGWNLISFNGQSAKSIETVLSANKNIFTVWSYDNGWKAWSPINSIQNAIAQSSDIGDLTSLIQGKGYWINTTTDTTIGLDLTPPSTTVPNFVLITQIIGDGGQVASLAGVSLYDALTGDYYGSTNEDGKFDISTLNLSDGTAIKAVKEGYASGTGKIQAGFLTLSLLPLEASTNVEMVAAGSQKPLKKYGLISNTYANVAIRPSTASQSLTFSANAYKSAAALPKITSSIKLNGKTTKPKEISIVGAVNITLKGANKKTIEDPSTMDGKLNFNYKLEKFLGDLDSILNGLTGTTNKEIKTFNPQALALLQNAQTEGLMEFYLIQQQKDGSWIELDKAIPVVEGNKIKLKKATDGDIQTFGSGNIAYIIKTTAVQGSTEICFDQAGYRMNDGSVITKNENNSSATFDFIGNPIKDLVLLGDSNVVGQPLPSDKSGCTTVNYKVPYLAPMYEITAVSSGNFDKTVTIDVNFGDLNKTVADKVKIYKIPKRATIQGYVTSRLNDTDEKPVGKAIVTLADPQILTKQKVLVDNTNGKKTITLENNPNVAFTYTLSKEDDNKSVEIKSGILTNNPTINVLTQKDIENIIYSTDSTQNPWLNNPYGNYIVSIKAVHTYAPQQAGGENLTLTEEMQANFRAKVDENALLNAFSVSVNQGDAPWYKDNNDNNYTAFTVSADNSELINNELPSVSIFGGKDISLFKPLAKSLDSTGFSSFPDASQWDTYILSSGSAIGTAINPAEDPNPYLKTIVEVNAGGNSVVSINQVLPKTTYNKQYMKFSQVYKIFNENFSTLVKTDFNATSDDVASATNDANITIALGDEIPLYQAGFTVFNTYQATFERAVNYRTYAGSYTNLNWFKLNSVDDFSNILNFKVSANEATAYSARYTTTEDNGFYQINKIAPEIIPALGLTVRAEGTEFGVQNERLAGHPSSVNGSSVSGEVNATAGDILEHDFVLKRIAPPVVEVNTTIPSSDYDAALPIVNQDFENGFTSVDGNWTVSILTVNNSNISSNTAKWQVVHNDSLPVVNQAWATNFSDGETNSTILPTPFGSSYIWLGDKNTGTYSDSGKLNSNTRVASALTSPLIDFSQYSIATLNFKQWFETSAYDASFDTAFVGFEIPADENNTAGTSIKLEDAGGFVTYVKVGQTYITRVTPNTPVTDSSDKATYVSNNGLNTQASWSDYKIPLDLLAGKKAKIVFGFFTKDSLFNNNRGWGIDNVFIQDSVENFISLPPVVPTLTSTTSLVDPVNTEVNTTAVTGQVTD